MKSAILISTDITGLTAEEDYHLVFWSLVNSINFLHAGWEIVPKSGNFNGTFILYPPHVTEPPEILSDIKCTMRECRNQNAEL
jgi:hypothetical protein